MTDVEFLLDKMNQAKQKELKDVMEKFERREKNFPELFEKFKMLGEMGERKIESIKQWGSASSLFFETFYVKVEDFGKIKKAFGCLEKTDVRPVEGKRSTVVVRLAPKDKRFQYISFEYEYKLKKTDKCKIVTKKEKEVVCSI